MATAKTAKSAPKTGKNAKKKTLVIVERTLEFLATSAEPVDITADALPGDWSGGHYTVSEASRAAVQSFFNLSPAAAQSASGSEP